MSGTVSERKRLLRVTAGNLRHSHIYINGHYDFFPADCTRAKNGSGKTCGQVAVFLEGMNETVETEIALDAKTGKPRGFFRGRKWVRQFFKRHGTQVGDLLALERTAELAG